MAFPLDYIPSSGSQLERALAKYFFDRGATPQTPSAALPYGGIWRTLEPESDRKNPLRTIMAQVATDTSVLSGNQTWAVTIIDQFDGVAQVENTNPEAYRVAIDRQIGRMLYWMMQTSGDNTLRQACKNITDAGRSLAPTFFILAKAGTAAANGRYNKTSDTVWTHISSGCTVTYDSTADQWQLADSNATVLYTHPVAQFPHGTWTRDAGGTAPVPVAQWHEAWNHADMANFTCLHVWPAGQSRGDGTDENGIKDTTWREVRNFNITCCPAKRIGFSNTEGE